MKSSILKTLLLLSTLLMSCKKDYALQVASNDSYEQESRNFDPNKLKKGYQYFEFRDNDLRIQSTRIQLPKSWKRSNSTNFLFEGPNNMRIGNTQMSAINYNRPLDIYQIIETYFVANSENGDRPINIYELPKIAKKSKDFLELNYSNVPTQYNVTAYGIEWKESNGINYFTVLRRIVTSAYNSTSWAFMNQHVEAPNQYYDAAKTIFIDAILSEQHNTDWLYKKNKQLAQKLHQQYKVHQARMDALKLNSTNSSFTSSTSSSNVGNIYSDILDINHSGYLKRSNMTSHGQSKTIRGINETSIISNHNTGEHYSVPAGSKYYWVNSNGRHFGTDNANYDPRTDRRINQTEWSQFQIEN